MITKPDSYYETLDKRTREYKEWAERKQKEIDKQPKGLGDTVEKVFDKTGIKGAVHFLFGDDCGCDKRKEWLNSAIKYKVQRCATQDQYEYLKSYFRRPRTRIPVDVVEKLVEINNYVFDDGMSYSGCEDCGSYINKMILRLKLYYDNSISAAESHYGVSVSGDEEE